MKETLFRLKGIHKELGKVVYLNYASHKTTTHYNFTVEKSTFKHVKPSEFMGLQLIAQSELVNITWECNNKKLEEKYQKSI